MTADQKDQLMQILLCRAGDIVEFWSEIATDLEADGVTAEEARQQLNRWLRRMPTHAWDSRLGLTDE